LAIPLPFVCISANARYGKDAARPSLHRTVLES